MVDKEIIHSIVELSNPKTGENFTEFDAQRILRAAVQRRAKASRRITQWLATHRNGKESV